MKLLKTMTLAAALAALPVGMAMAAKHGGKSYKVLSIWQTLSTVGDGVFDKTCALPIAKKDTPYLIKVQARTAGRPTADVSSNAYVIWMLTEEREVTAAISTIRDYYEYKDAAYVHGLEANIVISEPVSGTVEYQLQYSTDGKKWATLSAHDWRTYDDGGAGSIDVGLNLAELSGDTKAYIKVNARMKGSTKIEDDAVVALNLYNIMPVFTAALSATPSGDESVSLTTTADDGGYGNVKEYRYSYALAGQSKMTWVSFTSWVNSASVTFTPSLSGDYLFKVEVRSKGRLGTDITAEATNDDSGYYLKSIDDMLLPEATPEPTSEPSTAPSAEPSTEPSAEPSTEPSAEPSTQPAPSVAPINSLEFAQELALGENADISAYTETEVALEDLFSVLEAEDAPSVIVQLGEVVYAVITEYTVDEDGELTSLTLSDPSGETILGGTEGIIRAWYYAPIEAQAAPSAEPAASEPSAKPADMPDEPSETPAA